MSTALMTEREQPDELSDKVQPENAQVETRLWIKKLRLTNFRNYDYLSLDLAETPVVLVGVNGAGKTNLLEALSLLSPGQGLRRAPYAELARASGLGDWAVAADLHTPYGDVAIGTGLQPRTAGAERSGRSVRIDHQPVRSTAALGDYIDMVWLTPALDGLFTGPSGDRRRFIDRLIVCFDPGYRTRMGQFERAMRQRNRLLEMDSADKAMFEGLEIQMAELGTSVAAARLQAVDQIAAAIDNRRAHKPNSPFPWAELSVEGELETLLRQMPAIDAEDAYLQMLHSGRSRDRAAKRTLQGPHRSDLLVGHGPKTLPAKVCSTGEQKALLINLILAHAELSKQARNNTGPIMLLDEISAHLDHLRRGALFNELMDLGIQAWLTGTDRIAFDALAGAAQFFTVDDAEIRAD